MSTDVSSLTIISERLGKPVIGYKMGDINHKGEFILYTALADGSYMSHDCDYTGLMSSISLHINYSSTKAIFDSITE